MKPHAIKRALSRAGIVSALVVPFAAVTTGLLPGVAVQAQTAQTGSLSFVSDPGDWIGGGASSSYSTANGDTIGVSGANNDGVISVSVNAADGEWWYLSLAAPSGQALAAGDYTGATRYPFNAATDPGLDFSGDGRGCNTSTGSFDIIDVTFGPEGYVQQLDATFVQHCEGGTAALTGEVHIQNPPPPPALDLGVTVATDGTASTVNGKAAIHGTVTCTVATPVTVNGTVTEVDKSYLINGAFYTQVDCTPGAAVAWSATATPNGLFAFQKGKVEVQTDALAFDPNYGQNVTVSQTSVVTLKKTSAI